MMPRANDDYAERAQDKCATSNSRRELIAGCSGAGKKPKAEHERSLEHDNAEREANQRDETRRVDR